MSRGKYSPSLTNKPATRDFSEFCFNAKGKIPPECLIGSEYCEEVHFDNYDSEGFDRYGYSAYDSDGKYVGGCSGVDRNGITEMEYRCMFDEEFEKYI